MPHVSRFRLNGVLLPSVNACTGSLSQDGLIRNFFRKHGFRKADKIGGEARDKGIALATAFEEYRKTGKMPRKKFEKTCLKSWLAWRDTTELILNPTFVEPHLVNTKEGYHGSPDVVMCNAFGEAVLGDDKAKKRLSDYKVLMNEHAYAMCDSFEVDGVNAPVPWDVPIRSFWIWTYSPETGTLYPELHMFDDAVWQDFLTCKKMLMVNRKSEKYFDTHCQTLPDAA